MSCRILISFMVMVTLTSYVAARRGSEDVEEVQEEGPLGEEQEEEFDEERPRGEEDVEEIEEEGPEREEEATEVNEVKKPRVPFQGFLNNFQEQHIYTENLPGYE
ncbi:coiled-coil domain-containing glutamate-rich protein 1-like [Colias croceus]|uniref:coiled-coil domain-containing glutamate-rich protein 1-like n=1 Tax=Colias crocea TaxID=72248 RepID=UPI001E27CD11|nr:coiled-coil domain-containing glutamate-rich protein 1-like [Colias croceus]